MPSDRWYKNAIIYSLDLETFMDANADGTGDFTGLSRHLEYLHALGVDVIWLAPFQPSPNRDNGYDIKDYYGVDPRHGSSGEFAEFMHAANNVGIKVIIDLVVNHTSDMHPWFKDARKGPDARYHNWYVWAEERPKDWDKGMVFPGVQRATWTKDEKCGQYYFHRFYEHQPDLNIDNPEVRDEIKRIMGFYLALGVAGFRVDAVPFLLETQGPGQSGKRKIRFEYLEEFRRFLQWRRGDAILLGEANVAPEETMQYFGAKGEGLQMMFNFYVNQFLFYALASGDVIPLKQALEDTRGAFATSQWANFLRNHDELDLGRLSDAQREKVFTAFGPEPEMQLYERGIRRRLAPMLGNRAMIELAYSLMLSLPGTPVLRYGDEIGMGDDLSLEERDAVRTPMQWSHEENAGFSRVENKRQLVHPIIDDGPYDYRRINVEQQMRQPDSLLNWTKKMLHLRKECPEIGSGDWTSPETGAATTLAMNYTHMGRQLVVVHNFSDRPLVIALRLPEAKGGNLVDLREPVEVAPSGKTYSLDLGAYGYRWFRVREV